VVFALVARDTMPGRGRHGALVVGVEHT
jgi:hypothetical protein